MKSKHFMQAACMLLLSLGFQFAFAQGGASVMGRVTDPDTKQPASDITVVFECQGNQTSFITNDSGFYYTSKLPAGLYNITASFMSNKSTVEGVKIGGDDKIVDLELSTSLAIHEISAVGYKIPLIDPIKIDQFEIDRSIFKDQPITKLADVVAESPGVNEIDGKIYVHGAREGGLIYYIDGSPVMASADIPLCGLETYTIYSGFIPPQYGDAVGGVVVLETRNFFTGSR